LADIVTKLKKSIGESALYLEPDNEDLGAYTNDWTKKFSGYTPLVLRPRTVSEVSKMVSLCNDLGVHLVPQGGNTGVVGGSTPRSGEVILSLSRLNNLGDYDPASATIVVEAGTVLTSVQEFSANKGMEFPIDLGARGQCQIGGMLATNAGGNRVLRYGMMREQVRGLEIVLADGTILSNLNRLRKDNSGIDLKQIFVGSEGILGVITRAVLQLSPAPEARRTALFAIKDRDMLPSILAAIRESLPGLSSLEVILQDVIELVIEKVECPDFPLPRHYPAYIIVEEETESGDVGHSRFIQRLEGLFESGLIADAVVAESVSQSERLWHFREATGEAIVLAGHTHKFDVTVPQGKIPIFLEEMEELAGILPGCRPLLFGHLGDGNIHVNFVQTSSIDDKSFLAAGQELSKSVYKILGMHQGSVSAEHGIGMLKREYLPYSKTLEEINLMRNLKATLDPNGILNPGVMLLDQNKY
tara:strand:+ start:66992 stop:68407 length:1416 start_codon:yes stop_codon:yes gene_type:complete